MDHSQPKRVSKHLASLSAEFKHGTATRLSVCLVLDLAAAPPSGSLLKKATQGLELHVRSASTEAICHRLSWCGRWWSIWWDWVGLVEGWRKSMSNWMFSGSFIFFPCIPNTSFYISFYLRLDIYFTVYMLRNSGSISLSHCLFQLTHAKGTDEAVA